MLLHYGDPHANSIILKAITAIGAFQERRILQQKNA